MNKNYQPILLNKITDDVVIAILDVVIPIFKELQIEYFIVGAFARDIELLAKGYTDPPARKTKDLDLAVMLSNVEEFHMLIKRLTALKEFEVHHTIPIRLTYASSYQIDLLPFGEIANEKGEVKLRAKKTLTLDMPGFTEVYGSSNTIKTDQGYDLNVCSLPGVILLKLIAWEDTPERIKDIQDIDYIIKNLYLRSIDEIYETDNDLLDLLDNMPTDLYTEAITARYIGRKIGTTIKDNHTLLERVKQLLARNTLNTEGSPMGKIMSYPTLENAITIINQLFLGIEDTSK